MSCQLMAHGQNPVPHEAIFTLVYPNDKIETFQLCREHGNRLADLIIEIPTLHKSWRAESLLLPPD